MSNATEIRRRTDDDIDECIRILRSVHLAFAYPVNWPIDPGEWLRPDHCIDAWVATSRDRVVGHVALTTSWVAALGTGASVERLFVDTAITRNGIGRRLLDHCAAVARAKGFEPTLEVADNCHAAIALYRSAGWHETGQGLIRWGGDEASSLLRFQPSNPKSRA